MTDRIRDRHQPADTIPGEVCDECGDPWPCLVIQALDQRDAARADADRLAEALRGAPIVLDQTEATAAWEVERAKALRAHDEATGPRCLCGADDGEDGVRTDFYCPKHD